MIKVKVIEDFTLEKFNELKKNAQMQGEFELRVQDFEESTNEIQ